MEKLIIIFLLLDFVLFMVKSTVLLVIKQNYGKPIKHSIEQIKKKSFEIIISLNTAYLKGIYIAWFNLTSSSTSFWLKFRYYAKAINRGKYLYICSRKPLIY